MLTMTHVGSDAIDETISRDRMTTQDNVDILVLEYEYSGMVIRLV